MKKTVTLLLIVGMSMLAGITKANTVCFTDAFGYRWTVTYSSDGSGHYSGWGTVDIGSGTLWNVTAWSQLANLSGSVELHAANPNPDGCNSFSDSFIYVGTCQVVRSGGVTTSFSGSGSWTSYCFGGVLNFGTWDASGPCGNGLKSSTVNPNGPASHAAGTVSAKASNTVCFSDGFGYVWTITYSGSGGGGYTGSGTVDIGSGTLWRVNASGEFSNLSGDVELHAANPNPDGCNSYSDSFVYVGSAQVFKNGSSSSWSGSGSWTSYCFGGVLNFGDWFASGPCGSGLRSSKIDPNGPATHGSKIGIAVSPNPAHNQTSIAFKLGKQSQVQVTVYDYLQQPVRVLANGIQTAGKHSYTWDLRDASGKTVSNGLYRVVTIVDGKSYSSMIQVVR